MTTQVLTTDDLQIGEQVEVALVPGADLKMLRMVAAPGGGLALPVSVPDGGTGQTSLPAHSVLLGEGTSPVGSAAPGAAGLVLTSNGPGLDPTFQPGTPGPPGPSGAGPAGTVGVVGSGTLNLAGDTVDVAAPCTTDDRVYSIAARCVIRCTLAAGPMSVNDGWSMSLVIQATTIAGVTRVDDIQLGQPSANANTDQMAAGVQCGFTAVASGTNTVLLRATGNGNNAATPLNVRIAADIFEGT